MARNQIKTQRAFLLVKGFSEDDCLNYRSLPNELWKECPLLGEFYEVSNFGRVRTVEHDVQWFNGHGICIRKVKGIIRKGTMDTDGYIRISIKRRSHFVHRLVMSAFVGENELTVNHINGIKTDNRLCNLEYLTQGDNLKHAWSTGLFKRMTTNFHGILSNPQKISNEEAVRIREMSKSKRFKQKELAKMYNVHLATISRICRGIGAYSGNK